MFATEQIQKLYDLILHDGIRPTTIKSPAPASKKQGAIFAVYQKEDFTAAGTKGRIIVAKDYLLQQSQYISHFTPNVFRTFKYTDQKRQYIQGYEERNLLQINTFVVDIDTKRYSREDILMACIDDSIGAPTVIVETTRGYQVYFVLSKPLFLTKHNKFKALIVAKRISQNLKRSLSAVQADMYCNDFTFFRLPKADNIVHLHMEQTYDIKTCIDWSMRQDDDNNSPLFFSGRKQAKQSLLATDWFNAIVNLVDIKGSKGVIGRNNALFTAALLYLQEGKTKDEAYDMLDQFNSNLRYPLHDRHVRTIVQSAYSGKYCGASKMYIELILETHLPQRKFDIMTMFSASNGWYKFKKERHERERNHYEEWERDLLTYLEAKCDKTNPFYQASQKEICNAIGIPQSTLNELIKRSNNIVIQRSGKGRGAKTYWSCQKIMREHIIFKTLIHKERVIKQNSQLAQHLYNQSKEASSSLGSFTEALFSRASLLPSQMGNSS